MTVSSQFCYFERQKEYLSSYYLFFAGMKTLSMVFGLQHTNTRRRILYQSKLANNMSKFENEPLPSNIKRTPRNKTPESENEINSSFWEDKDHRENDSLSISYKPRQNIIIQNRHKEDISGHFCFVKEEAQLMFDTPLIGHSSNESEMYRNILKEKTIMEKKFLDAEYQKIIYEEKVNLSLINTIQSTKDSRTKKILKSYLYSKVFKNKRKVTVPSPLQLKAIKILHFSHGMSVKEIVTLFGLEIDAVEKILKEEDAQKMRKNYTIRRGRKRITKKDTVSDEEQYKN